MTLYASKELSFDTPSPCETSILLIQRQILCQSIFKRIQNIFFSILKPILFKIFIGLLRHLDIWINAFLQKAKGLRVSFKPEWFVDLFKTVNALFLDFD